MRRRIFIPLLALLVGGAFAWSAEDAPKAKSDGSLIGGRLRYTPPPDDSWERAANVNADDAAAYAGRSHQGAIAIQVLPVDAEMTPQMGGAVVRALRDAHKKADQKILFGPKVEPDKRFDLRVHEKYQSGDKIADELHLYRTVGPRVVMVTVNAWVSDDAGAKPIHSAGEDVLVTAKWTAGTR
jgi:hypothetical protein